MTGMRSGILLSVREKATRFPGKVLKPLGAGTNVTQFLLRRLKTSNRADEIILATSSDPRDAVLCEIAAGEGVHGFKGSADDKLLRYRDAARAYGLNFVVVVDGDDPLVSVGHIDRIIECATDKPGDFILFINLPLGATGHGLRASALERVCESRPESDTEVWGGLFLNDPSYHCVELREDDPVLARPDVRMTLDYPEDYEFFTAVIGSRAAESVSFEWVMKYLRQHPDVVDINRGVQIAFEAHLKKSTPRNN
jgi:spore coat polysaccharide biosynthesis protein SpsF (cytidylyltransferase family)